MKSRRRSLVAEPDNGEGNYRARGRRSQKQAPCGLLTRPRTTGPCLDHDGHARHVGSNSGGGKTHERRSYSYGTQATDGAHEDHLGDAEDDLERVGDEEEKVADAGEERGPWRCSTARAQLATPTFDLRVGKDRHEMQKRARRRTGSNLDERRRIDEAHRRNRGGSGRTWRRRRETPMGGMKP